jgi:hypothetical protein
MAVKNLNSLVLISSPVLCGGKAGNPRLGASLTAYIETPEIRTSMPCPSCNAEQEFQPASRPGHADYCRVDAWAVSGAGRSLRCAGVLRRSGLSGRTRSRITVAWCKPANRMLPASIRGFGVR